MKSLLLVAASVGVATAQLSYDPATGVFSCPQPNQAYCAKDSLQGNIIIRCDGSGVGQPGNCNNNVAGQPPLGNQYSPCWQNSTTSGDAACSKSCVVYGSSGNFNGTFTLPVTQCLPINSVTASYATPTPMPMTPTPTMPMSNGCESTPSSPTPVTPAIVEPSSPVYTSSFATPVISGPGHANSTGTTPTGSNPTHGPGSGAAVTPTSPEVTVSPTPTPTAGAVSRPVAVGLGLIGLIIGAIL